jgi:RNA polymerase sigma factor (sigma-70 family)
MSPVRVLLRTQSDARLVELARHGHDPAFEEMVRRYRQPLIRYCRRLLRDDRADEAVQQALVDAWDALRRGAAVRDLRPWLYRIAYHTAVRAHNAPREVELTESHEVEQADVVTGRIELRATLAAVAHLPGRQRDAVMLSMQGFAGDEVAASLGLTNSATRQLLHRARAALRAAATAVTPWPLVMRWAEGSAQGLLLGLGSSTGAAVAAKITTVVVLSGTAVVGGHAAVAWSDGGSREHRAAAAEVAAGASAGAAAPAVAAPAAGRLTIVTNRVAVSAGRDLEREHRSASVASGGRRDGAGTASEQSAAGGDLGGSANDDPVAAEPDDPSADAAGDEQTPGDDPAPDDGGEPDPSAADGAADQAPDDPAPDPADDPAPDPAADPEPTDAVDPAPTDVVP